MINDFTIVFPRLNPNHVIPTPPHTHTSKLSHGFLWPNLNLALKVFCGLDPTKLSSPNIPSRYSYIPATLFGIPFL